MSEHDQPERTGDEEALHDALFTEPEVSEPGALAEVTPASSSDGPAAAGGEAVPEEPEGVDEAAALREELAAARGEAEDLRGRLLRKAADLENARKRHTRERDELRRFGAEGALREVVSVLDDLERALGHAREGGEEGALADGVEMVVRKFQQVLERVGCRGFVSEGEPFDPNRHDALQQVEDPSVPSGTVVREFQRGYWLHDRLLRPAMVVVARGGPPREEAAPSPEAEAVDGGEHGAVGAEAHEPLASEEPTGED